MPNECQYVVYLPYTNVVYLKQESQLLSPPQSDWSTGNEWPFPYEPTHTHGGEPNRENYLQYLGMQSNRNPYWPHTRWPATRKWVIITHDFLSFHQHQFKILHYSIMGETCMQFTIDNNIQMDFNKKNTLIARWDSEKTIMEMALSYIQNVPMLQVINRVRMSLKVIWMSELATADGRSIDQWWTKKTRTHPPRNTYAWLIMHHTTSANWSWWKWFLQDLCGDLESTLLVPLGPWKTPTTEWKSTWDCFITRDTAILYMRSENRTLWHQQTR